MYVDRRGVQHRQIAMRNVVTAWHVAMRCTTSSTDSISGPQGGTA